MLTLLYAILPVVIGGILNMIWVKSHYCLWLKTPMDSGACLKDGKRIFGDNKTWKGFWGMIVLTMLSTMVFHAVLLQLNDGDNWVTGAYHSLTWPLGSLWLGAIWGAAYVIAELPNSFVKRRINIQPGKNGRGLIGLLFTVIDQADSVIGCVLVMPWFFDISFLQGMLIVCVATAVHFIVNVFLYIVGLKKQAR